jgi:hypothetical protein
VTGMPRPLFDREAIEAEIGRVRSLDLDELRTLWRVTFRSSPPSAWTCLEKVERHLLSLTPVFRTGLG